MSKAETLIQLESKIMKEKAGWSCGHRYIDWWIDWQIDTANPLCKTKQKIWLSKINDVIPE